jgi:hypothetical protein
MISFCWLLEKGNLAALTFYKEKGEKRGSETGGKEGEIRNGERVLVKGKLNGRGKGEDK